MQKAPDGRFALKAVEEILKLNIKLNNYDNLLIAKVYYYNGEYEKAREILDKTTIAESWTDFAKTEYKLNNNDKTRYYTELGLKEHSVTCSQEEVFEVIDNYIATYPTRKEGIKSLLAKNYTAVGADYIEYLNCNEIVEEKFKEACFRTVYEKYPNGTWQWTKL